MEYRPRSSWPGYRPPNGYMVGHGNGGGYVGGRGNGGYAGGGYGGGHGNGGAYAGGYRNGGYLFGGGDGRPFVPYGRGAVVPAGYGAGEGMGRPLGSAGPSTSHGQGWGWGADEWWAPPPTILPEAMAVAEAAAGQVLLRLHPTAAADRRRHEIIDNLRRLIGTTFGCEVYVYGSVPLKTYLPDGDIDMTILTNTPVDSAFIDDVYRLLSSEAENDDAQFTLQKIGIINAKVKLIKCIIDNVVVDISFNQVGGVSKLCFLEMVDSEIQKDHLFKKSIILIKSWIYHERNIHGSNQWLLSTYSVEIMILYIFNTFHKSLHGPLQALYKFLEYYSKFDWDNHCVTLNGPMPMPSWVKLNEPVALNDELLLSMESFKGSLDRLIVLPTRSHRHEKEFIRRPLNIIDPLKGDNNLGTSVNQENSGVIRDAFKCGAQKLGQILKLPSELIPDGIYAFFTTTLGRHGRGERPDLGDSFLFQSMLDSENRHEEDVSSLQNSYTKKDENRSPDNLLGLTDKESGVKTNMHLSLGLTNFKSHPSSSSEDGNTYIDSISSQHILTSSTRANSLDISGSYPIIESNGTDVSEAKLQLPPFTPPNLLDLSGDLGLALKCFRSVQYNLEAFFDKFRDSVKEASLAGMLDDGDCFNSATLRFLWDTDGWKLSTAKGSQGTRDVPQQSTTNAQVVAPYQPLSGTHIPSSGFPSYQPAEAYHHPWFQNTEDTTPQAYGAGMYIRDMYAQNFSLPPRTDTLSNGSTFFQPVSVDKNNYSFSSPYIPEDARTRRGTGTYFPRPSRPEIWKEKSCDDKMEKQMQSDHVYADMKPDRVNSLNGHAAVETALANGEIKQVSTSETTENGEQRYVNGSRKMPTPLPPLRIALPHHGGEGQGNLLVPSTGQPSPSDVTTVTPAIKIVNSQSITPEQHGNLEFGSVGPFSATRLTAKFIEDFPPLPATKKPVQAARALAVKSPKPGASAAKSWPTEAPGSAVQSPKAVVSVTQSRPVEAPASAVQSPKPSESAAQCRPEESYKLKDDADFPPLQAGTRYNADFPPLRAAAR